MTFVGKMMTVLHLMMLQGTAANKTTPPAGVPTFMRAIMTVNVVYGYLDVDVITCMEKLMKNVSDANKTAPFAKNNPRRN